MKNKKFYWTCLKFNWVSQCGKQEKNTSQDILVTSTDEFYPSLASLLNKKGVFDTEYLINHQPVVKKESYLISIFHDLELTKYRLYIERKDVLLFQKIRQANFYIQHLRP